MGYPSFFRLLQASPSHRPFPKQGEKRQAAAERLNNACLATEDVAARAAAASPASTKRTLSRGKKAISAERKMRRLRAVEPFQMFHLVTFACEVSRGGLAAHHRA